MHIPTAQEQLKFLKNIQLILQSGSFSSTYKFALLISLSRLAIEKGEDSGESLSLEYTDIAEKFIELYWKQAVPYTEPYQVCRRVNILRDYPDDKTKLSPRN